MQVSAQVREVGSGGEGLGSMESGAGGGMTQTLFPSSTSPEQQRLSFLDDWPALAHEALPLTSSLLSFLLPLLLLPLFRRWSLTLIFLPLSLFPRE